MVPKLRCTGRNAHWSRWSLSHFKVSLRPNWKSICSGSTMSLTAPSMFYLRAGRNPKHTPQPFTISLAFEMTLGQKHGPGSAATEASGHPEQSLLVCAPGHLNSRSPQNAYCLQTVWTHNTRPTRHTLCAQKLQSRNSCHSNSAHFSPEKFWSIALAHTTEGLNQTTENFDFWLTNSIWFTFIFNSCKCLLRFKKRNKQHLQRWTTQ